MADDSDSIVRILIQMGLDDAAAKAATDQIKSLGQTAKETGAEMDTIPESLKNLKAGQEDLDDSTEKLNVGNREMRRGLEELNRIFPGLGHLANLAAEGFREMGKEELTASEATDALITSLGPIAIVLLTIQAATQYWDMYKESVKAAAEAQSEASKKMVEDTTKALDAWQNYQDVISGKKDSVTKPFEEKLQRAKAVQEAVNQGANEVLAKQKSEALAGAQTPEQKAELEKQYADKEAALKEEQENANQEILNRVRDEVQKEMLARRGKADAAVADQHQILGYDPQLKLQQNRDAYNKDASEVTKQTAAIEKLQDLFEQLTQEVGTAAAVQNVHEATNSKLAGTGASGSADTTVANAVSAYSAAQKGKLTADQQAHIKDLTDVYNIIFGNTDLLKQALTYAHNHALNQAQEIQLIKNQLANLTGQIGNGGMPAQQ